MSSVNLISKRYRCDICGKILDIRYYEDEPKYKKYPQGWQRYVEHGDYDNNDDYDSCAPCAQMHVDEHGYRTIESYTKR